MSVDQWARCSKYIEDALQYAGGTHTIQDVMVAVSEGKAQFFPLDKSAIVTEIVDYPQKSVCRIWLAGGDLDELKDAEVAIAVWAKTHGCDGMEIIGRRGWSRTLSNYRQNSVVLTREI
ncbi:MAG: hypothetical protein DWQ28_06665 [Proteobacteria bacterium]|nr:MAG: hypothetical protein DWQ28_06360 [Pseudomonadota bacterium]REJ67714.1 MAG: hypothetical protein DWQ28_06665 [Pseudomonadota bacterium]